jgi:hypothetical protein
MNAEVVNSCGTQLPWIQEPFRLISWLEMLKFRAQLFVNIGASLSWMEHAFKWEAVEGITKARDEKITREICEKAANKISDELAKIGCRLASKAAQRLANDIDTISQADMKARAYELRQVVWDEMEEHLFVWIPAERASFYSKDAEAILGAQCCARFPSIKREVEESGKCYAVGRYTASAFHLTRAAEAGVQALAKAIKFKPPHNQWSLVFERMKKEYDTPPAQRPKHWKTHGRFLTMVWSDLVLAAKVWRNDIAHLVAIYTEEQAKELLEVLPKLLRDLATKMDEKGRLYK